jgi:hypothetical protein
MDKECCIFTKQCNDHVSVPCPYCGYRIVACTSPKYLKCLYCCKRWKLEEDE